MGKQMKIGFIQATNKLDIHRHEPLAFGYLKAYTNKYFGSSVNMELLNDLGNIGKFEIIGVSSTSQNYIQAKAIAKEIKNHNSNIITILGGQHITCFPHNLSKAFDIGVLREGEETFRELMGYFTANGLVLKSEELKKIKGLVFRTGNQFVTTLKREPILPLDVIPFPYRFKKSEPYLFSSRGCPYNCAFCVSPFFWGKVRFFSAEYLINEIEYILNQFPSIKHISIWDDLFIVNNDRFKKFIKIIKHKKNILKLSFNFSVRANFVSEEMCDLLKGINVTRVSLGVESGSDKILKRLNKGTTVEMNQTALDRLHKFNIKAGCSFIVGVPTETEDDVRRTYEFIIKNIIDKKNQPGCPVNILMPVPGTSMWDYAVKSKIINLENFDWNRLAIFASYRDSNAKNLADWIEQRRKNNSVYLAEESLPQEKLYELMNMYEKIIMALEKEKMLSAILNSKSWKITASIRKFKNLIKR